MSATTQTRERRAIRRDAEKRLAELVAVRDALAGDVAAAHVMSEYARVVGQIKQATAALEQDETRSSST